MGSLCKSQEIQCSQVLTLKIMKIILSVVVLMCVQHSCAMQVTNVLTLVKQERALQMVFKNEVPQLHDMVTHGWIHPTTEQPTQRQLLVSGAGYTLGMNSGNADGLYEYWDMFGSYTMQWEDPDG